MASNNKNSNFLKAVKKQSEEQRRRLIDEISLEKNTAVKEAEAKYSSEAEKYINHSLCIAEADIKSEYAVKTLRAQGELFKLRDEMIQKILEKAKEKLISFAHTDKYRNLLCKYAKEIAEIFGNCSCVIYYKSEDVKYCDEIKPHFKGEVEFKQDDSIVIGGIKGYCEALKIIADNTLDVKLEEKKTCFLENTTLKII